MSIVISVNVDGAAEIIAKLSVLQISLKSFKTEFANIGRIMFNNEEDTIPVRGGGAKASMRMTSTNMQATVAAGGANRRSHAGGIYVHKLESGGGASGSYGPHRMHATHFAERALIQSVPFAIKAIEAGVERKIKEAGL